METIFIAATAGALAYNLSSKTHEPDVAKGTPSGTALPPPRVLWSDPAQWITAPIDITYLPYQTFTGPYHDPRRAYILPGGAKISHSGYNNVGATQTNQVWAKLPVNRGDRTPGYTVEPIQGIGNDRKT